MSTSGPELGSPPDPVARANRGYKPTMSDVARVAGVSRPLVSIVIRGAPGASEETRERILKIADEIGYLPDERARKLRQSSSRLLGITFLLQQPFHGDLVEQFYLAASRAHYDIALSALAPTRLEPVAVASLLRERCEALIMLGSEAGLEDLRHLSEQVPVVMVARPVGAGFLGVVRGDDRAGMRLAVEHLAELGHRRIAYIDGASAPGSADRRTGYLTSMQTLGLSGYADVITGGLTESDGARGLQELMDRTTPPTAVIAFNDRCATGVMDMAARKGYRVPDDLSVMGYDDSRLARIPHVQMTTISQDAPQLASAAVELALEQIGGSTPRKIVVSPRLVVRESTKAPIDAAHTAMET